MIKAQSIQIVIIHDSQSEAEPLVNLLRGQSLAVHSYFIASEGELEQQLHSRQFDLALIKQSTQTIDVLTAIKLLKAIQPQLPRLMLTDSWEPKLISQCFSLGANLAINESQTDLLTISCLQILELSRLRTQNKLLQSDLKETEQRCQLLLDSSMDAIAYVHEGMHIFTNPAYMELFGYDDADEMACIPLLDLVAGQDLDQVKVKLKSFESKGSEDVNAQVNHANGEHFGVRMTFSNAQYDGERCLQIVIRKDDADNSELQEKLKQIQQQDLLTGLYNQQAFSEELEQHYSRCLRQDNLAQNLFYIQLTNMMDIKADMGISAADQVLADAADQLRLLTQDQGCLGRLADDVFAWLVPSASNSPQVAAQIHSKLSEHLYEVEGKTITLKVAIGIGTLDAGLNQGKDALAEAHHAANAAHDRGQAVVLYDRTDSATVANSSLIEQIKHALQYDHFRLLYQPIISLKDDLQETYEVLMRLNVGDEQLGPHDVLRAADAAGLALELDQWVAENAIRELAQHRQQGADTKLFLHLTPATMRDAAFLPWLNGIIRQHRLPGDAIVFQISEEDALTYLKQAKIFGKALSVVKCRLAISHFGHMAEGISLLKHLNVDYIKVDARFVQQLHKPETVEQLKALIKEARLHDVRSIVPQIEESKALSVLWSCGADYIQGYYLQKPTADMNFDFSSE